MTQKTDKREDNDAQGAKPHEMALAMALLLVAAILLIATNFIPVPAGARPLGEQVTQEGGAVLDGAVCKSVDDFGFCTNPRA